jgi:hypothetical protein
MEPSLVYGAGRMQYEDLTQEPRHPKDKYRNPARAVAALRRLWGNLVTNDPTGGRTCDVTVPLPAERSV